MATPVRTVWLGPDSLVTALGDKAATLEAIEGRRTGLAFDPRRQLIVGALPPECLPIGLPDGYTRLEALAIRAVEPTLAAAGLRLDDDRVQLLLSTTKGNVDRLAGCGDTVPDEAFLGHTARQIARYFQAARPPIVISNACISGLSALIVGQRLLHAGECDHAIVVGIDLLSEFITEGFRSFQSLSDRPCRPYDADRDGLTLGEACGALLLTTDRQRALEPAVALPGGAVTNDANHISGPSRTGDGLYHAIRLALEQADTEPRQVGTVNTHGTATLYNDEMESKALRWARLDHTPANSLKGYFGHTLGASGIVESILCAEELRRRIVYGTQGFSTLGVPCAIEVSPDHRPLEHPCCVKTASGFGGCNAAIVLAAEADGAARPVVTARPEPSIRTSAAYRLPRGDRDFGAFIRDEFRALDAPNLKFYKMSDLAKALYVAAERLLSQTRPLGERYAPTEIALVLSNRSSSLDTDLRHQRTLDRHEPPSPAHFVYTLPNVAAGEICIRHRIQGDNTFFIEEHGSDQSESYARLLLRNGHARAAICGRCELLGDTWEVDLKLLETADEPRHTDTHA
ncbi:beta-ketoacyl synthase N-terminal-like domain-containing protein [uncultured Rikenella sp.]|uniref:beta-ketoacyl synthase N-terminal-like domain-containing protein n=1 Tax=uncultured Rikenella sp. TaxID=368003 RepID=UPI0026062457|nr:beta-ketoacyl synthase N-terminal-like domain-containing protein [uncultured Rikenella sp.]